MVLPLWSLPPGVGNCTCEEAISGQSVISATLEDVQCSMGPHGIISNLVEDFSGSWGKCCPCGDLKGRLGLARQGVRGALCLDLEMEVGERSNEG